jgi:hypothetical protein
MSDNVLDISQARFSEAKQGQERSKAAVLAENEHLKEQQQSMQQLLAAILARFGEESIHLKRARQLVFRRSGDRVVADRHGWARDRRWSSDAFSEATTLTAVAVSDHV